MNAAATSRPVGRPRQYDDDVERQMLLDAAYAALRDNGAKFTVAEVLNAAGVSTRSFYRHFDSRDALLTAMYRRDAEWAADRLGRRLAEAGSPTEAVEWWIDEIYSFVTVARRAERVAVLGSIATDADGDTSREVIRSRDLLIEPLAVALGAGTADGSFRCIDPRTEADLLATSVLGAVGLGPSARAEPLDKAIVVAFVRRALGVDHGSTDR